MYAKIITLLALLFGSLTGVATVSQSATGDNIHADRPVESVQLHVSQDATNPSDPHPEAEDPSRPERVPEEQSDFEAPLGCHTTDGTINSEVEAFANQLGLSYESVLAWYCAGYSFGTIQVVYDMSVMAGVSVDQIYEMRVVTGLTWDQIIQALGITFSRDEKTALLDEPRPTR